MKKRRVFAAWRFFVPRRATAAVSVWILAAGLTAVGCRNPFSLRTPEDPDRTRSTWMQPLYPEAVLENLRSAVLERNADHFLQCLADPAYSTRRYRFEPDPETAAVHPEVFVSWSREREESVMRQSFAMVPDDSVCTLEWREAVRSFIAADSAVFVYRYRLDLPHRQSAPARRFEGLAEFRLAEDGRGEWSVFLWIDHAESAIPSWSMLKAFFGG
jgi:hypothetical protein